MERRSEEEKLGSVLMFRTLGVPVVCTDDGTSDGVCDFEVRHPSSAPAAGEIERSAVEGLSQPASIALNLVFWFGAVVCVASIVRRVRRRPPGVSRFRTIFDGTLRPGERSPWLYFAAMALMFASAVVLARA